MRCPRTRLALAALALIVTLASVSLTEAGVKKPFKTRGCGVAESGLPLPGQDPRPHNIVGNATHLGRHTGSGTVKTDSAEFDPVAGAFVGEFGSADPFVFEGASGDKLVCHYGRVDKGASGPGTFELTILEILPSGEILVEALFFAEFVPQPESTGKFKGVDGAGSWSPGPTRSSSAPTTPSTTAGKGKESWSLKRSSGQSVSGQRVKRISDA